MKKKVLLCLILVAALFAPFSDVFAACGHVDPPPPVTPPVSVPEPATLLFVAMGLVGLVAAKRKLVK